MKGWLSYALAVLGGVLLTQLAGHLMAATWSLLKKFAKGFDVHLTFAPTRPGEGARESDDRHDGEGSDGAQITLAATPAPGRGEGDDG